MCQVHLPRPSLRSWGVHYLRSLARAHLGQVCNNFKATKRERSAIGWIKSCQDWNHLSLLYKLAEFNIINVVVVVLLLLLLIIIIIINLNLQRAVPRTRQDPGVQCYGGEIFREVQHRGSGWMLSRRIVG